MALPNFLIIGAMKAGTTSLSDALSTHPDVFIPASKEPNSLVDDAVLEPDGRADYEALFERSGSASALGEASTGYTKRHLGGGVAADHAHSLLGPDLRLIYLVRDPVDRAASHAKHLLTSGRSFECETPIEPTDPVAELGYYAHQLEPWLTRFGSDNLLIVDMADLIADWETVRDEISDHLSIDRGGMPATLGQANASNDARPARGAIATVLGSKVYRKVVQERIPMSARRAVRRLLVRRAPVPTLEASTLSVADQTLERWRGDKEDFRRITGSTFQSMELDRRLAARGLSRD